MSPQVAVFGIFKLPWIRSGVAGIALVLWSAVAALSQTTDAGALSGALRAHLQEERFQIVTSVRGLPLGVRDRLQTMFGSATLDIAEPGADFQAAETVDPKLPTRRLVAAGCSSDFHCLVYYERGGSAHTWHVALFQWSPAATRFEGGGAAPGGLSTVDDVRRVILAGWMKARFW